MKYGHLIFLWGPVAAWMGLIYFISAIPRLATDLGIWDLILRKLAHMGEFAVLAWLLVRAAQSTWPFLTIRGILRLSGAISIFYALTDEFHQRFVPGRVGAITDVLIDAAGVSLFLFWWWHRQHRPRLKKL